MQRNGNARILNYRGLLNVGVRLSDQSRLYVFGSFNRRQGHSAALWRLPAAAAQLNTHILDGSGVVGAVLGLGG